MTDHLILFIASLVLCLAGTWFDMFYTSLRFRYYGQTEGNSLFRDKCGYLNLTKAVTIYGILIAAVIVGGFVFHWFVAVGMLTIIGIKGVWAGTQNYLNAQKQRKQQIAYLRDLRAIVSDGLTTQFFWARFTPPDGKCGRAVYGWFGWIYADIIDHASLADALAEVRRRIEALSQQPETEWFPK